MRPCLVVRVLLAGLALLGAPARAGEYASGGYNNKDAKRVPASNEASSDTVGDPNTPTGTGYVHVTDGVEDAAADRVTLTSDTEVEPNQGTTTTVLHGNAAGQPSWAAVSLTADVSGILGDANGGTGSDTTTTQANQVFVTTGAAYSPFAIPDCDDASGQHLNYDTTGPAFSCGTSSSTAPAPPTTSVQFNDGGALGGDADLVWDKTNNSLGIGAAAGGTAVIHARRDVNAAATFTLTNAATGKTAHPAFQLVSDTGNFAMRSHSKDRTGTTQCGNVLAGTNDLISVTGTALTACTLSSQPFYVATTNTRRLEVTTDGVTRFVDSGTRPTCDSTKAGGLWFDAGTPDTYEVCTKDGSSVYAWRPGQITDTDKGDVTVSGTGATWTIDNDAVTWAKLQNVTDARLLGRSAGSSGDAQEITVGSGLSLASGALTSTTTLVKLPADRTNSSSPAAYADVAGLSFPVLPGVDYAFDCTLVYQSAATTTGIGIAVNGPGDPAYISYSTVLYQAAVAAAGTDNSNDTSINSYDGMAPTTGVNAADTNYHAHIQGVLSNGANAGTLVVRFKNEVNSSRVTIKKGSWCIFG